MNNPIENRSIRMLLQSMPPKGFAATFVIFITAFLVCIIIGATGPPVYDTIVLNAWGQACQWPETRQFDELECEGVDLSENMNSWTGEINNLDRLNQEVTLYAALTNKQYAYQGVTKNVKIQLSIDGRDDRNSTWMPLLKGDSHDRQVVCKEGKPFCESLALATLVFIGHRFYQFNVSIINPPTTLADVQFTFSFVNRSYTLFELWFRYVFLLFGVLVLIGFTFRLRNYPWSEWTLEQKWATVLLFALIFYNNPFYPIEILVEGSAPMFVNRLFYATFLVLLLLFWLTIFDGIRQETAEQSFVLFYLPKLAVLGTFWVCGVGVFVWSNMHLADNPAFTTTKDMPGFLAFLGIEIVAICVYLLWMVIVVARGISDAQILPYLGIRIRFFLGFTIAIIVAIIIGILFGFFASQNNAAEFLSFIALLNLYVYVLAFVYLPSSSDTPNVKAGGADRIGMVRLEDDDIIDQPN